jgi:hypothetical protein
MNNYQNDLIKKELHKKIDKLIDLEIPLGLTINLDGNGGYKLESKLGDKAINKIISNI